MWVLITQLLWFNFFSSSQLSPQVKEVLIYLRIIQTANPRTEPLGELLSIKVSWT